MRRIRLGIVAGLLGALAMPASAQLTPPTIVGVRPPALIPGGTTDYTIRGTGLEADAEVVIDDPRITVESKAVKLGDALVVPLKVAADTAPGPHSLRLRTRNGPTGAWSLPVGRELPVVREKESNDDLRKPQVVATPVALTGSMEHGDDVDVFAVEGKAGTTLVAEAIAARGGSSLDPLVTIYDADGRELASDDDLFGSDAVASAYLPAAGRYLVAIQDADGRKRDGNAEQALNGRRDYVLNVGTLPVISGVYPPGGRRGSSVDFRFLGVNMAEGASYRGTIPADAPVGELSLRPGLPDGQSNPVRLRVGDLPEFAEPDVEPADDPLRAPVVVVPAAINGRFQALDDGDLDLYRLKVEPGNEGEYRITVFAAAVGSSADPVATILDEKSSPLAEDDDKLGRDARLERRIDSEVGVVLALRDYHRRGGPRYVYRVEVEPLPALRVVADVGSRIVPRKGSLAIPIAFERHGYDGPVTLEVKNLPAGVTATPATGGEKSRGAIVVLTASADAPIGAIPLRISVRDGRSATTSLVEKPVGSDRPSETTDATLFVTDPASLGVSVAQTELALPRGGEAKWTVTLDRRGDAAKKPVKLKLIAPEAALDGIEVGREATVAADKSEHVFNLKATAEAAPRRVALAVHAWYDGGAEGQGIDSAATTIVVPEPEKSR